MKTQLRYFKKEDVLHLVLDGGREHNSTEPSPNVTAEVGGEGRTIGIEIRNARKYLRDSLLPTAQAKLQGQTGPADG